MPPVRLALYAVTCAVLAMTAHAIFVRPPPLALAAGALAADALLVVGGALVLPWRVYSDALLRGPRGARGVALTFDDGPHPRWTPAILELLARRGLRATFFVVGRKVEQHPGVVKAILEQGHAVELHSYAHDRFFS